MTTSISPSAALAVIETAFSEPEKLALAGFPAGYSGQTREACALDLRADRLFGLKASGSRRARARHLAEVPPRDGALLREGLAVILPRLAGALIEAAGTGLRDQVYDRDVIPGIGAQSGHLTPAVPAQELAEEPIDSIDIVWPLWTNVSAAISRSGTVAVADLDLAARNDAAAHLRTSASWQSNHPRTAPLLASRTNQR